MFRLVDLDVSLPLCEEYMQFSVNFPTISEIYDKEDFKLEVPCTLKFTSTKTVSITDFITITEKQSRIK